MNSKLLYTFLIAIVLFQCGGSDMEEGDEYYQQGKYQQAINAYLAHKKSNPEDPAINSKIVLAYLSKGAALFKKTKNIDSFAGNFEKSQKYMEDDFAMPEQRSEYSSLLYKLAVAYKNTRPQNEIQKEEYFDNTLNHLTTALEYDPDNKQADSLRKSIYQENFQKRYDKGMKFLAQAKKERNNPDLYLNAERYLNQAVKFNPQHEEAYKQLSKVRKETLGILESNYPISFCIPAYKKQKNNLLVNLIIQNFSADDFTVKYSDLVLYTADGEELQIDPKKTEELKGALADNTKIGSRKRIEGNIVFKLKGDTEPDYLSYNSSEGSVRKYFP